MSMQKRYDGYTSFQYLDAGSDYQPFDLAREVDRVESFRVQLAEDEEARVQELAERLVMVSLHEHLGTFPADIAETPAYVREGRTATAFRGLAASHWDCVFDNLLDGICTIESKGGWKWTEILHDLGMRLCDLAHQDFVRHCLKVGDITAAHDEGRLAWVASMEGAAMIENEVDRIDLLYGFGVRALGITYSESNALGSGLREPRDGGLTVFGKRAVARMNKLGMLIDCSHCGDQTTLDTIETSEQPIILSHIGARALWDSNRLAPDDVLEACAAKGGLIGIEAAPHTTITRNHPVHDLDAYMEHFQYIMNLVGIDHVGFGPDSVYGDHVGLHRVYSANLSIQEARGTVDGKDDAAGNDASGHGAPRDDASSSDTSSDLPSRTEWPDRAHPEVEWVKGIENPTEGSHNILRWLVKNGYSDEDIEKVIGGNALRLLGEVWAG